MIGDFTYSMEGVPVILGDDMRICFMNPITQLMNPIRIVVYPNYKLTACDPIAPDLNHLDAL